MFDCPAKHRKTDHDHHGNKPSGREREFRTGSSHAGQAFRVTYQKEIPTIMGWAYGGEDRESISTGVIIQIDLGHVSVFFISADYPAAARAREW